MNAFPFILRSWQGDAQSKALHHLGMPYQNNFLAAVCPGAGKTIWALSVAHRLFEQDDIQRLFVVVHTDHLRNQWIASSKACGIELGLDLPTSNRRWGHKQQGTVLTYQQITSSPRAIMQLVTESTRQAVIFDEIHHAGDGRAFSDAVREAFRYATYRLLLTGTPFRNDNRPIPYVKYDKDGRLMAQYEYSYGDALSDGYVAPVHFYTYDLDGRWKRGDEEFATGFGEHLGQRADVDRLNTAVGSKTWREALITDAFKKLKALRNKGDINAGMLIVARDIAHAGQIERETKKLTGEKPVVVTSDDAEASRKIAAFRESHDPIIIAVRMISEGVDIPRLRVGVYLTNVRTDLFFWQWVGRYVRVPDGTNQLDNLAHLYMPAERFLVEYASTVRDQRVQVLEPVTRVPAVRSRNNKSEPLPPLQIVEAAARFQDEFSVVAGHNGITPEELEIALEVMKAGGIVDMTPEQVVRVLRAISSFA